eukprot:Ihof_evm1s582 gene=Ihof_evmTU1s582
MEGDMDHGHGEVEGSLREEVLGLGTDTDTTCLSYSDLTLEEELGRGAFGVVYAGGLYGSPVAIKMLHINISNKEEFVHEINVMRRLRHPNIVLFLGATVQPDPLCIITELVGRGALMKVIEDPTEIIDRERLFHYALDIARGMNYLHHCGVIHLDLTPNNVLVTENYICKVGDFGLSKVMSSTTSVTNKGGGTVIYTAPEVYKGERIQTKVDIYSFAICLWQLHYRKLPYEDMHQHAICFNVVANNLRPEVKDNNLPPYSELMQQCWSCNPLDRPSFDTVIVELEKLKGAGPDKKEESVPAARKTSSLARSTSGVTTERPQDPQLWTEADVINWAEEANLNWAIEVFQANDINGKVLLTLTVSDMKELGIKSFGWRRSLVLELKNLIEARGGSCQCADEGSIGSNNTTEITTRPSEINLDDVEKFDKGHALCKITPPENSTCDRCDDIFYEFDRVYRCKTCSLVLHKECWSSDQERCVNPVAPPPNATEKQSMSSSLDIVPMPSEDRMEVDMGSSSMLFRTQSKARRSMSFGEPSATEIRSPTPTSGHTRSPLTPHASFPQRTLSINRGFKSRKTPGPLGPGAIAPVDSALSYSSLTGSLDTSSIVSTGGMVYTGTGPTATAATAGPTSYNHGYSSPRHFKGMGEESHSSHKEDKEWKRFTSTAVNSLLCKLRLVSDVKEQKVKPIPAVSSYGTLAPLAPVQQSNEQKKMMEMILGQVLMAKKEGMSDFNNRRYEFAYMKFKAAAEATRGMCGDFLKNSTGTSITSSNKQSLGRQPSELANNIHLTGGEPESEEDKLFTFVTMVHSEMEMALKESSMLVNPEYNYIERSNII